MILIKRFSKELHRDLWIFSSSLFVIRVNLLHPLPSLLFYGLLYCINTVFNNQNNARALIGQSAMVYCASKLMEKSHVFWIII